jgi:hypothetical protein
MTDDKPGSAPVPALVVKRRIGLGEGDHSFDRLLGSPAS